MKLNVLNLYAGLGGNRKEWDGVNVTAIELNQEIANIYKKQFPKDEVIIDDAHDYLLNNYEKYDFIWSSPPCQSHSRMVKATRHDIRKYPDMKLYQEILLLQHFFKGRWVVENVKPYYKPLIKPSIEIGRHLIWSNFDIMPMRNHKAFPNFIRDDTQSGVERLKKWLGIEYDGNIYYEGNHSPGQVLRNCVHPEIGKHVFNESMREGLFSISDFQTGGKNLKTD